MKLTDYYKRIQTLTEEERMAELDCLAHYYEADGKSDYSMIANICRSLRFSGIVDIGCAYGFQSDLFLENDLYYHGIDDWCTRFWNDGEKGISYQTEKYPCKVKTDITNLLAVSRLCVGYSMMDYESLSSDFPYLLVICTSKIVKELTSFYTIIATGKGKGNLFLLARKGNEDDMAYRLANSRN